MVRSDDLPTDAVLRRHALTERDRVLGWPPTDSVLRRHHAQWMSVQQEPVPASASSTPRAPTRVVTAAPAPARVTVAAPALVAAAGGRGLFGWLRRLLGV